jgi:hypothetical protein
MALGPDRAVWRRLVRRIFQCALGSLLALAPLVAGAQATELEGRWFALAADGSSSWVAEVSGTTVEVAPLLLGADQPISLTAAPGPAASSYRLQRAGADTALLFLQAGGQTAAIIDLSGGPVLTAYRLGPVPSELVGSWSLMAPAVSGMMALTLEASGETSIVLPDMTNTGVAEGFPLPALGPCVIIAFPSEPLQPLCFLPVGEGTWLVAPPGEAQYAVAFRPEAPPAWLDQIRPHVFTP